MPFGFALTAQNWLFWNVGLRVQYDLHLWVMTVMCNHIPSKVISVSSLLSCNFWISFYQITFENVSSEIVLLVLTATISDARTVWSVPLTLWGLYVVYMQTKGIRNTKPPLTVVAESILPQTWLFCIQLWEWNIQTLKNKQKTLCLYICISANTRIWPSICSPILGWVTPSCDLLC